MVSGWCRQSSHTTNPHVNNALTDSQVSDLNRVFTKTSATSPLWTGPQIPDRKHCLRRALLKWNLPAVGKSNCRHLPQEAKILRGSLGFSTMTDTWPSGRCSTTGLKRFQMLIGLDLLVRFVLICWIVFDVFCYRLPALVDDLMQG